MNTEKYLEKISTLSTEELKRKQKRLYKARMADKAMPYIVAGTAFFAGIVLVGHIAYYSIANPMKAISMSEYNTHYKNQQIFSEAPQISKEEYDKKFEEMNDLSEEEIVEKYFSEETHEQYKKFMDNTRKISRPAIFTSLGIAGAAVVTGIATSNATIKGFHVDNELNHRKNKKEEELKK